LAKQIEISNLTQVFGTHTVLEDITLSIEREDFISVVGPNGGGKSTLFKLMLGLISPTKGTININGISPIKNSSIHLGYVPQLKTADRSFPALAVELVASGIVSNWVGRISKELREKCLDAMEKVNAEHLADKSLSSLSGGELQRGPAGQDPQREEGGGAGQGFNAFPRKGHGAGSPAKGPGGFIPVPGNTERAG